MKKKTLITTIVVVLLLAAALGLVVYNKLSKPQVFTEGVQDPVVAVANPETRDIVLHSSLVGTVEPEDVVYIYPKASGDVTSVYVKAGDKVEAGQLLLEIDTKQVESAKSSMDSAALQLQQAKEELSRESVLYQSGGLSEQAYQQYQDSVKSAQISYDNAKNNYDNQVSYSQITSPITGTVESFDPEVYDTVSASDLLCVISADGAKIVSFSTTERIKKNINEGDIVEVEKDGEQYNAVVYEISSMADSSTGLYKIKARLDVQEEHTLPTGSTLKLSVVSSSSVNTMTVPINAVYYDGGLGYVYTYDNGTVHKVQVEVGLSDEDYTEILSGISTDDEVITTWSSELSEGATVRLAGESSGNGAAQPDGAAGAPDVEGAADAGTPDEEAGAQSEAAADADMAADAAPQAEAASEEG